jgi:hypothetical protein
VAVQVAVRALLVVVEGNGDPMAHIGIMRALRAGKPTQPPTPRRKPVKRYQVL